MVDLPQLSEALSLRSAQDTDPPELRQGHTLSRVRAVLLKFPAGMFSGFVSIGAFFVTSPLDGLPDDPPGLVWRDESNAMLAIPIGIFSAIVTGAAVQFAVWPLYDMFNLGGANAGTGILIIGSGVLSILAGFVSAVLTILYFVLQLDLEFMKARLWGQFRPHSPARCQSCQAPLADSPQTRLRADAPVADRATACWIVSWTARRTLLTPARLRRVARRAANGSVSRGSGRFLAMGQTPDAHYAALSCR